jgi:anhydro-N-acetylmuramic acid kinase
MKLKKLHILGVMTGTSADGLDASCVEIQADCKPVWHTFIAYPKSLRTKILEFQKQKIKTIQELFSLDVTLGEWFGTQLKQMIHHQKIKPLAIANHGQTVFHKASTQHRGSSVQIANPSIIAYETGLTTISHFRNGDIAAYGKGAPLAPLYHLKLAEIYRYQVRKILGFLPRCVSIHNIGGFSNLTAILDNSIKMSFDTGPGNCWIDAACSYISKGKKNYDHNGSIAAKGKFKEKDLERMLAYPFFQKKPPKSTGRDDFPFKYFLSCTSARNEDLVSTATAFTAFSIAKAYERFLSKHLPIEVIFICGGGANNTTLIQMIQSYLPIKIIPIQMLGYNPQTVEAEAFAWLGFLSLFGKPLGGSWTGAKCTGGPPAYIVPGQNFLTLLKVLQQLKK